MQGQCTREAKTRNTFAAHFVVLETSCTEEVGVTAYHVTSLQGHEIGVVTSFRGIQFPMTLHLELFFWYGVLIGYFRSRIGFRPLRTTR